MESRRTTNDGRGKKKRIRWRGGSFVPVGNHLLFRRGSPIQKKLSNPAAWGSFCSLSYLDIGRRGRKNTTSMDKEATLPRPFFFLLSAFAYAEKSDQTNTMLFLPIPLFLKHLPPTHPFQGSPFPPSPDHFLPLRPAFLRLCAQGAKICLEARTQRTSFPFICLRRRRKRENVLPPLRSL